MLLMLPPPGPLRAWVAGRLSMLNKGRTKETSAFLTPPQQYTALLSCCLQAQCAMGTSLQFNPAVGHTEWNGLLQQEHIISGAAFLCIGAAVAPEESPALAIRVLKPFV
jgi:hypothetical protein